MFRDRSRVVSNLEPGCSPSSRLYPRIASWSVLTDRSGAHGALDWAIAQAQRTGAVLDVVTAWMFPMAIGYAFTTTVDEVRRGAQKVIDRAITHVAQVAPDVVVHGEATEQSPAPALVSASKSADLLVVGSRGMGGFRELMVGSVGQYCTRRANCSVVVVR